MNVQHQKENVRDIFRKKSTQEWNKFRSNLVRRSQKQKEKTDHESTQICSEDFQTASSAPKLLTKKAISIESLDTLADRDNSIDSFGEVKGWDVFRDVPVPDKERSRNDICLNRCLKILKLFTYYITFLLVLTSAVISKGSLLFMTSQIKRDKTTKICNLNVDSLAVTSLMENVNWTWSIFLAFSIPQMFTFITCLRQLLFKSLKRPTIKLFLIVLVTETLHTVGLGCLIFKVFPELDSLKGAMLTNCLCLLPGILSLFSRGKTERRKILKIILDVFAIGCQASGCIIWPVNLHISNFWPIPVALILTSVGWWENYVDKESPLPFMKKAANLKETLKKCRYKSYCFISIWKIIVMFLIMIAFSSEHLPLKLMFDYKHIYAPEFYSLRQSNSSLLTNQSKATNWQLKSSGYESLIVMAIQVSAALICFHVSKFNCKICIQRFSFAFPINLTMPVVVSLLISVCGLGILERCSLDRYIPEYLYWECYSSDSLKDIILRDMGLIWFLWLFSQSWITLHIWKPNKERLAKTERLFILPLYEGFIIDQSLALNRRRNDDSDLSPDELVSHCEQKNTDDTIYESISDKLDIASTKFQDNQKTVDSIPKIYACTTIWHENSQEMMQLLKSIKRMDEDQSARRNAIQFIRANDPDYYEFEAHVFFDDAFDVCDETGEKSIVNSFVIQFIELVDIAASAVHQCPVFLRPPKKIPTPYGGRLVWTLPGRNKLVVHLKDKTKIRQRKRWSQVMYMYYLLGHCLMDQSYELQRKDTIAENTYILMLDGDIDFSPNAVQLLLDLMKKNPKVGAACGRIHPIGSGPMVWYQQFEYAIGHWLQKATEHMIGCVLCSPGCFSLFRAKALMDDSVMKRYTMKSEKARHYIQFDQGEDRWLCTLLLQRGYRVEYCAASDAYTHVPEGFDEFYNQRKRWIPSTMANIMDLLSNYKQTIRANDNISFGYIIYQIAMMVGTILGSGTIFLMIVGALVVAFKVDNWTAFLCNIIPITCFIAICLLCKPKFQLICAQVLSTAYALMMMAVIVGIILQVKEDGVTSPSTIFMLSLIGVFFISALLHPLEFFCIIHGILYFICIPSMYLLMTIYSLCNLNDVSWGTREIIGKKSREDEISEALKRKTNSKDARLSTTLLKFLKGNKINNEDENGNVKFTCGNLCQFTFCLQPQTEDVKSELIVHGLEKVLEKIDYLETKLLPEQEVFLESSSNEPFRSPRLRKFMYEDHLPHYRSSSHYSDKNSVPDQEIIRDDISNPFWLEDPALRFAQVDFLSNNEIIFWRDLISKYIYPLANNNENTERLSHELKEFRNKVVFGFFMLNSLFILIIFLLQIRKEDLYIPWVIGYEYNITNITTNTGSNILSTVQYKKFLHLEPLGVLFIFFFMIILLIQFLAMLFHRLETLSHILASTELNCCATKISINDDDFIERNAVEIARALQALRGLDEDNCSEGSGTSRSSKMVQRRNTIIKHLENSKMKRSKTRTLDVAFKKRFFALQNEKDDSERSEVDALSRNNFMGSLKRSIKKGKKPRVETFNLKGDSTQAKGNKSRPKLNGIFDNHMVNKKQSEETLPKSSKGKAVLNTAIGKQNVAYLLNTSEDDLCEIVPKFDQSENWIENETKASDTQLDNMSNNTEIENF